MCAEEFASFLETTRKAPLEEKLNDFGDIVEKIMQIVLKISDLVDQSLQTVNTRVTNLQNQLTTINNDLTSLKAGGPVTSATSTVSSPALGAPPGGPPLSSPPGGPPGGPPPPPGGPGSAPAPNRPASPVSLRGAIMGELKELFAKRKSQSG
ncbi:MAG: hypothetical protein ACFFB0_01065 [Promethearchaeota archaeon]